MKDSDKIKQQLDVTDIVCQSIAGSDEGDAVAGLIRRGQFRIVKDIEAQVVWNTDDHASITVNLVPE